MQIYWGVKRFAFSLRSEVSTRGHFFTKDRNQPQPEHDDDSNEFSYEDDDNRAIRKQVCPIKKTANKQAL